MIRPAQFSDLDAINSLSIDTFGEDYHVKDIDPEKRIKNIKIGYLIEKCASILPFYRKMFDFYVYEINKEIAGCVLITRKSATTFNYPVIEVAKSYQGQGIGRNLLEYCEKKCKKRGAKYITMEIRKENVPGLSLAKKCGFKKYGEYTMLILTSVMDYSKSIDIIPLSIKDYPKINKLEKRAKPESQLEIEGTVYSPSVFGDIIFLGREMLFGEKFYQYILKNGSINAYATISYLADNSSSLDVLTTVDLDTLKQFLETVLHHHGNPKMATMVFGNTIKNVLTSLGFEEYFHYVAVYKPM
ncbi:MAG: GNAT family N-acetyltransferase [Candidatus Methanofastidiosia archaeon]|jgi:ribosomal protein S18 acetylase RimI-like enzyme